MKAKGAQPDLPEVGAPHMVGYLMEVGPGVSGGGGLAAITHAELRAWQQNTGIRLTAWESRTLRAASRSFVDELQAGADRWRPAPYKPEDSSRLVADDLRADMIASAQDADDN